MKLLILAALSFISAAASADPACNALSKYVGNYKLTSQSCERGPFGPTLTVAPYDNGSFAGFMLTSGGIGIGPSTAANATDKCTVSGANVSVETCANSDACAPKYWLYSFSGPNVTFSANGCVVTFQRTN